MWTNDRAFWVMQQGARHAQDSFHSTRITPRGVYKKGRRFHAARKYRGALAAGKRAATARRAASALHPTHPRSALIKSWSHSKKAAEPETIKRGHMCDTPGRELCARRFLFTPQPHPLWFRCKRARGWCAAKWIIAWCCAQVGPPPEVILIFSTISNAWKCRFYFTWNHLHLSGIIAWFIYSSHQWIIA